MIGSKAAVFMRPMHPADPVVPSVAQAIPGDGACAPDPPRELIRCGASLVYPRAGRCRSFGPHAKE